MTTTLFPSKPPELNSSSIRELPIAPSKMHFLIPALDFITTNLWGLFGRIPFTAIQPSRPLLDRTVGCFQLASTVYTLEQVQPYFSQTRAILTQRPTRNITPQTRPALKSVWGTNATSQQEPISRTVTLTTESRESDTFPTSWAAFPDAADFAAMVSAWPTRLSEYSDAFSDWLASFFVGTQQPEAPPRDTLSENLVLILLVLIFSVLIKQTMQYPDTVCELERLRGEVATVRDLHHMNDTISQCMHSVDEKLQDVMYQHKFDMNQAGQYLQRIDDSSGELLKLGKGLSALRQDLISSTRGFNAVRDACLSAIQDNTNVVTSAIDDIRGVQQSLGRDVQDLRTTIELATDMRWALTNQLSQYPSTLCDQLAKTVARVVSEHLNNSTSVTTNDASSSGLENGHWGNGV